MVNITLTWYEAFMGQCIGFRRQVESDHKKLKDRPGYEETNPWLATANAACAEIAVAKYLNLFWAGTVNTFKTEPDVGGLVEVRSSYGGRRLGVRPDDIVKLPFVLAVGAAPHFILYGWEYGDHVVSKGEEFIKPGRDPYWQMDKDWLRPMGELRAIVKG